MIEVAFIDCLLDSGKEGGADIAVRDLAARLAEAGHAVRMITFKQGIPLRLPSFMKTKPLLREVIAFPLAGARGMKAAEAAGCDIVHLNSLALAPLYRSRCPVVVTLHNAQSQKFARYMRERRLPLFFNPLTRLPFQALERGAVGNIDRFIPVHEGIADFLVEELGVSPSRVTVIPNGVDTGLFRPLARKARRVIFVGRATLPKGFDTLIEAAALFKAPLLVVTNKIKQGAAERARRAGIEIVRDLSHAELAPAMAGSSLLVLPSWDEEQPLVVLEAMACGLPVVTTPAGASDLVEDGRNGLVVPPDDPRALAAAVNRLLDAADSAREMGEINRRQAEERHAWTKIAERVVEVYEGALRGRAVR